MEILKQLYAISGNIAILDPAGTLVIYQAESILFGDKWVGK